MLPWTRTSGVVLPRRPELCQPPTASARVEAKLPSPWARDHRPPWLLYEQQQEVSEAERSFRNTNHIFQSPAKTTVTTHPASSTMQTAYQGRHLPLPSQRPPPPPLLEAFALAIPSAYCGFPPVQQVSAPRRGPPDPLKISSTRHSCLFGFCHWSRPA